MNEQPQIDLASFIRIVRQRRMLIGVIALVAAALAFGLSSLQDDRYEASSDLLFNQPEPTPRVDPSEPPPDNRNTPERVAATNLALSSLETVTSRVRKALNSPLTTDELRRQVDLKPKGQADIVTITATGNSREEAVRIADTFAQQVVALRRERAQGRIQKVIDAIEGQIAGASDNSSLSSQLSRRAEQLRVEKQLEEGEVEIAQEAVPPRDKSAPKPLRNAIIGLVLGLILGVFVALLLSRLDRRLNSEEEVAEIVGAPVIARIPVEKDADWQQQLFLESFQFLRSNLQLRDPDGQQRVIAITSGLPGNGKTTVAARLAEAFALSGSSVTVVDCDLRRPSLHRHFGVQSEEGVTTAIVGRGDAPELVQPTYIGNLGLLAAGPRIPIPASIMTGTERLAEILSQLRAEVDYVIIDTSPVTIGADTSAVAAVADATIMVVDIDGIQRDVLAAASEQLRNAQAHLVGVVLNRAEVLLQDGAYRGYYAPDAAAGLRNKPGSSEARAAVPQNGSASSFGAHSVRDRERVRPERSS